MSRVRGAFVGEFVTIVLGVLVALAADSAIERSRLRGDARLALEALRDDLASDVKVLTEHWEPELARQEGARLRLASFLEDGTPIADSVQFTRDVRDVAAYTTLDPNTSAIEELISTGGLGLIGNRDLRIDMLEYLNRVENIAEFDVLHRALFLQLYADLATRVVKGLALPTTFAADNSLGGEDLPGLARARAALALDADGIRSSGDLERLLAGTGEPFMIKANQYRQLNELGRRLLDALSGELAAR